jgi:hypothetical protein
MAEGFFCCFDVLYGGLWMGKLQFVIKKYLIFFSAVIFFSVADPGSGIGCFFDPWIRDPGWEKVSIRIRDPGSGMNNPDHIF